MPLGVIIDKEPVWRHLFPATDADPEVSDGAVYDVLGRGSGRPARHGAPPEPRLEENNKTLDYGLLRGVDGGEDGSRTCLHGIPS